MLAEHLFFLRFLVGELFAATYGSQTQGKIFFKGEDISGLTVDQRARKGLFLAFQYPLSIPGVPVSKFLRMSLQAVLSNWFGTGFYRHYYIDTLQCCNGLIEVFDLHV